jgi:hypothetical protein
VAVQIFITVGSVTLPGELFDTPSARAVAALLPLEARPNEWGDEFYFSIPVTMPLEENATARVKVGDIGYGPPGEALAIFFGPTPLSNGNDPVPASAVNIVGRITGDAGLFRNARGATAVRIEAA